MGNTVVGKVLFKKIIIFFLKKKGKLKINSTTARICWAAKLLVKSGN